MPVGQPLDGGTRPPRHGVDDGGVGLAVGLALDVGREEGSALSCSPRLAWKRVAAAGMSPADSAVEPRGTGSRSSSTASAPASVAASAAQSPAAPAPTISTPASAS